MKLRMIAASLCLAMLISLCTACEPQEINDAASLAAANKKAQPEVKSYHMDMDTDMKMSVAMDDMESLRGTSKVEMPVTMKMALDCGRETAHADAAIDVTIKDQPVRQSLEMYIDMAQDATYMKAGDAGSWTKSEPAMDLTSVTEGVLGLSREVLAKADFRETEDSYTLTLDAEAMGDAFRQTGLMDSMRLSETPLKDLTVDSGTVVYTLDKDSVLITKIDMDDLRIRAKTAAKGSIMDIGIPMSGTFKFSKYNQTAAADYGIPKDVADAADAKGER